MKTMDDMGMDVVTEWLVSTLTDAAKARLIATLATSMVPGCLPDGSSRPVQSRGIAPRVEHPLPAPEPALGDQSFRLFFQWCALQNLHDERAIADAFRVTRQTVRNWRSACEREDRPMTRFLHLCLTGYRALGVGNDGLLPYATVPWFSAWRAKNGLDSLDATGHAFGVTRQALRNWLERKRLPRALPLACMGYDRLRSLAPQEGQSEAGRRS